MEEPLWDDDDDDDVLDSLDDSDDGENSYYSSLYDSVISIGSFGEEYFPAFPHLGSSRLSSDEERVDVSDSSDEEIENDYSNELLKAVERLNKAVDKLGEIKTKPEILCSICYASPREYAYLPCGHFCVCESCMKKTRYNNKTGICPLCKQVANECHRIYL